jgi:hypothetical protein
VLSTLRLVLGDCVAEADVLAGRRSVAAGFTLSVSAATVSAATVSAVGVLSTLRLGLRVRVAEADVLAGGRSVAAGFAPSDSGACVLSAVRFGPGVRVAEADVLAGRWSVAAGFVPSVSGADVLSALRLVLVGFEALSSLSGVVVSAVGMPKYGVRHTHWKVPRPIPLEGVRRREFGGPARGC